MKRCCLLMLAGVIVALWSAPAPAQESSSRKTTQLTLSDYETVLERVLPCPTTKLRETRDFQLCLLIVPPGHRFDERELLAAFSFRRGTIEMLLIQPEQPLWRYASDLKASGVADWDSLPNLKIKAFRTTDSKLVVHVTGRSWTKLLTQVIPQDDWFMDATLYRIHAQTLVGSVALESRGPGPSARRQPSEVLSWAERVRREAGTILEAEKAVDYARSSP